MAFQLSYFKSWKMMLWKCCTQYASKFGKLSSGQRTGKGQFSFQSQRKAMPKNAQTTTQLHSSHTLVMFKILQGRLQQYHELPDVQAGFRKGRGTRDQIANIRWIIEKALISHASKVMLKILQTRLQQYVNHELTDVQAGYRKTTGTRDQLPTSAGSSKKQESSRKYLFLLYWLCQSLSLFEPPQTLENS